MQVNIEEKAREVAERIASDFRCMDVAAHDDNVADLITIISKAMREAQPTPSDARPVEINGHQEFWRGRFHCWTQERRDDVCRVVAIVETDGGGIVYVDPYKITFTDRRTDLPAD